MAHCIEIAVVKLGLHQSLCCDVSGSQGSGARALPGQVLSLRSLLVQVCKELHRFEKLMEYFRNEDSNIDFMVRSWAWVRRTPHRARLTADVDTLCRTRMIFSTQECPWSLRPPQRAFRKVRTMSFGCLRSASFPTFAGLPVPDLAPF